MTEPSCNRESCYCCNRGHFCEPQAYPAALGESWTCPGCGLLHESFDAHEAGYLPTSARRHIPAGTFGWRSIGTARV